VFLYVSIVLLYFWLLAFFWVFFTFVASFLQYFDTGGWVFKTVSQITYTVLVETLNPAQSIIGCRCLWDWLVRCLIN